jgi:hypothetical protein
LGDGNPSPRTLAGIKGLPARAADFKSATSALYVNVTAQLPKMGASKLDLRDFSRFSIKF